MKTISETPELNTPTYVQACAKKIAAEKSIFGVRGTYGALDGLANAYGFSKSYFDVRYSTESQATAFSAMHDWLLTPLGLSTALIESAILMRLAMIGTFYKADDPDPRNRQIHTQWKLFREITQAVRNAFKGLRYILIITGLVLAQDLRYLILPLGLFFSSVYALSRVWFVYTTKQREDMVKINTKLFKNIKAYGRVYCLKELPEDLTPYQNSYILITKEAEQNFPLFFINHNKNIEPVFNAKVPELYASLNNNGTSNPLSILQLNEYLPSALAVKHYNAFRKHYEFKGIKGVQETIQSQSNTAIIQGWLFKAYNGLMDSFYLLLGIITLTPLTSLLSTAVCFSAIYCILCVITRVYEEYESQCELTLTHRYIACAISGKDMEAKLTNLHNIGVQIAENTDPELRNIQKIREQVLTKQQQYFEESREALRQAKKLSLAGTLLVGAKHGIAGYGVLLGAIFTLTIIGQLLGLVGAIIPAVFIWYVIAAGIPIIAGFIVSTLYTNRVNVGAEISQFIWGKPESLTKENQTKEQKDDSTLRDVLQAIKEAIKDSSIKVDKKTLNNARDTLFKDIDTQYSPDYSVSQTCEVIRSWFSGILKGKKEVEFLLNPLQQQDAQGTYQDTVFMYPFIALFAILYAFTFALKAIEKGFKPPKEDDINQAPNKPPKTSSNNTHKTHPTPTRSPQRTINHTPSSLPLKESQRSLPHKHPAHIPIASSLSLFRANIAQHSTPNSPLPPPNTSNNKPAAIARSSSSGQFSQFHLRASPLPKRAISPYITSRTPLASIDESAFTSLNTCVF